MIVGKIDFCNIKKKNEYAVLWKNFCNCFYDTWLEKRHVVLKCCECGQLLAPVIEHVGPKNCGWKKIKNKWYCHQCMYHNGGLWDGKESDREAFQKVVIERNENTRRQLMKYQLFHPWVRFKRQ